MSNLSGEVVVDCDELFVNGDKYIHITNNNQLINGAGYVTSSGGTNVPTFPTIGTQGQIIKLKNNPTDGFEYVDFPTLNLGIASSSSLGGVKINGNNLTIDSTSGVLSATNTTYSEGNGIDIDSNNSISLNIAQASVIGGVKISGNNLTIDSTSGVLSATNTTYTEGDGIDIDSNNAISLDIAQASVIGGVKINGNNLTIDSTSGVLSATNTTYSEGTGIGIASNNTISLDTAAATSLGGIKVGTNLAIDSAGVLSSTNTTYTEGGGIDIDSNNAISLDLDAYSQNAGISINSENNTIQFKTKSIARLEIFNSSLTVPTRIDLNIGALTDSGVTTGGELRFNAPELTNNIRYHSIITRHSSVVTRSALDFYIHDSTVVTDPVNNGQRRVMTLQGDGKCGINLSPTTSPTETLHVNGNIKFTNKLATTDNLLYLIPNSTDDGGTYTDYRTIHLGLMGGDEVEGELRFGRAKVSDVRHHSIKVVCDSNNGGVPASNNYMRFAIHNGDGGSATGQLDVLTLNGEGYAGIGTTTPVAPLTIDAVGAIAGGGYKSHLLIMDQTAYDGANNGGGILFGGLINSTPTATTGFGYWAKISGEKANTTADDTAGVLKFWTRSGSSPQQRMIIDEDGKVGIGIADPTETLHANGNIKCVDLKFTRADTNGADQEVLLSTILASYTQLPAVSINSGNKVDLRTNNQTRIRVPDIGGFETEGRVDLLLGGMYSASTPNIGELRFTRADTTNVNITRHNSIFTQHSSTAILNTLRFAIHNGTYDGNGSNTTDALTLTGNGSAVVGSDLIVTGNCQAATYSGLPLAATDNIGVLMVGGTTSGLSISSGGVLTANSTASVIASSTLLMTSGGIASLELTSNALTIDEFILYTVQNMNVNSRDYLWRTPSSTIGSVSNFTTQGIRFVEGNDEFRCSKPGTFIVSFFIVCDNGASNERASFYAQVVKTFGGSEIKNYYVGGNSYYRDDNDNYDEVCLCGTITFSLKLDESFLIRSIRLYRQGNGNINTHSSSRLSIERLNTLTVIT